jgi:hypothetical protein
LRKINKLLFFFIEITAILYFKRLYKSDTLIMINNVLESVGLNRKRPFHELASEFNSYPPEKRFDYNRLSGRGRPMLRGVRGGRGRGRGGFRPEGTLSTQLAVRNIPPGINTIAHLNNHFARFGSLVNVQVHFEGDPASALVSY